MGLFDKKSSKNTTTNDYAYDYSVTSVDNTVNNSDNRITDNSDRSFTDNADNSFRVDQTDNSDNSYRNSSTNSLSDYSDNSLKVDMVDNSGSSNSGNSSYSTSSSTTTNITDGGAFNMVSGVFSKLLDSQNKFIDMVGLNQKETLSKSNDLVGRSLDAAMAIKKTEIQGEAVSGISEIATNGLKIVAVVGMAYAATKIWGKRS